MKIALPQTIAACAIVLLIWSGLFLPGLGSVELRHEEPRRALPGLHMLQSGDWIVPRVGASPYLRKPPLLAWLIAASIKLAGDSSEFAVRLPSVLSVLCLALVSVVVAGRYWLGIEGGLLTSLFFLTNITILETGRLAEIEAVYVSLTGIALILWMTSWRNQISGWSLWLMPAPFLALGMLAKGPTHLLFFYGMAIPVLYLGRDMRSMWHPAHLIMLVITVGAFACWALPCSIAIHQNHPTRVWRFWIDQIASRASAPENGHFSVRNWILNGPQTLKNFLPWTLLLPMLWHKCLAAKFEDLNMPRERALFQGAKWGMVFSAVMMCLLPSGSPRYIYPLVIVPCLLIARVLTFENFTSSILYDAWRFSNIVLTSSVGILLILATVLTKVSWINVALSLGGAIIAAFVVLNCLQLTYLFHGRKWLWQGLSSAGAAVICMFIYAIAIVPRIQQHRGSREVAASFRSLVPAHTTIWVLETQYRPFWYYLEPDVRYFSNLSDLPPEARYFILPLSELPNAINSEKLNHLSILTEIPDNENARFVLLTRSAKSVAHNLDPITPRSGVRFKCKDLTNSVIAPGCLTPLVRVSEFQRELHRSQFLARAGCVQYQVNALWRKGDRFIDADGFRAGGSTP
ncbi:MAG: glycosyltransferase family 39 protein [Verrucomicrobia bacterium]|nr:glycosyltransferase family 39 protein [Verrucomicrobiota bacterium]